MRARRQSRFLAALRWLTQDKFMEGVAFILALGSAGVGGTFLVSPDQNGTSRGFRAAMDFLDPTGWALVFIVAAATLIVLIVRPGTRRDAMWPAMALTVAHGGIALAFLVTVSDGAVPTGVWAYGTLCVLSAWLTTSCALTREDDAHAAPPSRLANNS